MAGSTNDAREADLVERARRGDTDAFASLFLLHDEVLRRFLSAQVGVAEDREDLYQEVVLRAELSLGRFRGRSTFETWLISIARHGIADYRRRKVATSDQHCCRDTGPTRTISCTALENIPNACDAREQIRECLTCIRALPLRNQVAVLMCDLCGFTDKEAAAVTAQSLGSFKHLLHTGRAALKVTNGGHCRLIEKRGLPRQESPCTPLATGSQGHSLARKNGLAPTFSSDRGDGQWSALRDRIVAGITSFDAGYSPLGSFL